MNGIANTVELRLRLSLRGLNAWRMYREDVDPLLLTDLFPAGEHLVVTHRAAIHEVFTACLRASEFGTAAALKSEITVRVMRARVAMEFEAQVDYTAEMVSFARLYDMRERSAPVLALSKFAAFLIDVDDPDQDPRTARYTQTLAKLWFEMCDAALTVQHVGVY